MLAGKLEAVQTLGWAEGLALSASQGGAVSEHSLELALAARQRAYGLGAFMRGPSNF